LYRDPTQWRVIAAANDIDDPRHLPIGARLAIPKLS
jgi:nucleoid-associated protein YgaU